MQLSACANQVLQEFGGVIPDVLIDFEDACREFLAVRALELQKLGVSTTDVTVVKSAINATTREGTVPLTAGVGVIPAFVELTPYTSADSNFKSKVEIVPVELIPSYEGARAIAFYGTPMKYRLSWDSWDDGTIHLWYDPIEDLTQFGETAEMTFPPNFLPFLIKKTALNLVRTALLKLAVTDPAIYRGMQQNISAALQDFRASLNAQVSDWEVEFKKWRNLDLNNQPHLRRTNDELRARNYDNVTGANPLDYIG